MAWTKEQKAAYNKTYRQAHREEHNARNQKYRQAHREEIKTRAKERYITHLEEHQEQNKAYYQAHKEEMNAQSKTYRETHKEEIKAKRKIYVQANRAKVKDTQSNWYQRHKEEQNHKKRVYHKANRETFRSLQRQANFNLTPIEYYILLERQGYQCAICPNWLDLGKHTHVDHCHKTKIIRGILCAKCNRGLGEFRDNPAILRKAIAYLEYWEEQQAIQEQG